MDENTGCSLSRRLYCSSTTTSPSALNLYYHTAIIDNPVNQTKGLISTTGAVRDVGECFGLDKWCVFS